MAEVEIEPLFALDELDPPVQYAPYDRYLAVDSETYVYFCEAHNHRILKYDFSGNLVQQIGGIGQGIDDLYWPLGIIQVEDRLLVLNSTGKEVKYFDSLGHCIEKATFPGVRQSDSFLYLSQKIVVDAKFSDETELRRQRLLSMFSMDGRRLAHFGRMLPGNSPGAQLAFNRTRLGAFGNRIFGAYYIYPAIFGYDLSGNELFHRNLEEFGIPEINERLRAGGSRFNPGSPQFQGDALAVTYLCGAVLARSEKEFYYALDWSPFLIKFDGHGRPTMRIRLSAGKNRLLNKVFALGEGDVFYGIVRELRADGSQPYLFFRAAFPRRD